MPDWTLDGHQDRGPVRFPLPEGHPLLDDEDDLAAALLQDAFESVEARVGGSMIRGDAIGAPESGPNLWWKGVSGAVTGATAGLADRFSGFLHGPSGALPAWGMGTGQDSPVRQPTHQVSEEHGPQDSRTTHPSFREHAMSFTEAPKVIGEPATHLLSPEVRQHYSDTCAIQCQRLILNQFGDGSTEESLVQEASARGIYHNGTRPEDVGKLLESHGIPVHRYENGNVFNLSNELAQGHKVIVGVESEDLWHKNSILHEIADFFGFGKADHAVIVSGIDTSDPDHIKVNITDPGTGDVAKSYPIEQFMDAWRGSHFMMVSTAEPAPNTLADMVNFPYDQGHIAQVGHAPFELVQGLSESVDPHLSTEAMCGVESHFFDAMNGEPFDPGAIAQVGPFPGDATVQALFDAHGSHGGHSTLTVAFGMGGHDGLMDPSFVGHLQFDPLTDSVAIHHEPLHIDPLDGGLRHHDPSLEDPFHRGPDEDFFHHNA